LLTLDLYFREPEGDSKRVETCYPKIIFYVIKTVVFDTLDCICLSDSFKETSDELKVEFKMGCEWY